jgi:hypothetical protein
VWFDFELCDRVKELADGTRADANEGAVSVDLGRAAGDIYVGV